MQITIPGLTHVSILDAFPVPTSVIDTDGTVVYVNDAFLTHASDVLGNEVRREDRVGRNVQEFVRHNHRKWVEIYDRVLKTGEPAFLSEVPSLPPDRKMHVDTRVDPIRAEDGRVVGALITRQDVTDRVQRQSKEERRASLDRVRVSAYEMSDSTDIQNVLISLYEALKDVGVVFDYCSVQIIDVSNGTIEYYQPDPVGTRPTIVRRPLAEGAPYQAFREKRPVYRADLDEEDSYSTKPGMRVRYGRRIRSVLDVPFSHGTVAINSERPDAFSEEEIKTLEQFAEVLSEAYTRFEDIRRTKESEEKFRILAEESPNIIFINKSGRVVYANHRAEELVGYRREEYYAPDFDFLTVIAPEHRARIRSNFEKHMKGQDLPPYEYALITKENERIEAIVTAKLIRYGGERAVLGIVTDITEHKRAEEALAWEYRVREAEGAVRVRIAEMEQPDELSDVVEEISNQLRSLGVDHDGTTIQIVNPDGTDFVSIGKRREGRYPHWQKIIGDSWGEETPHAKQYPWVLDLWRSGTSLYQPCLSDAGTLTGRSLIDVPFSRGTLAINNRRSHAFSERDVALLLRFAHVMSDGFQRFIDIVERNRAEDALQEAEEKSRAQERLSAVGQLAAGIAHDFNNLLTGIIGYAQLLAMRTDVSELAKRDIRRIEEEGQHAARLIRQILDFSRKSITQPQSLDLVSFLKESIRFLRRTIPENVRISLDVEPDRYFVRADPAQIQDTLTNLSVNARDAMPGGGDLRFRLSRFHLREGDTPPVLDMPPGEWIVVSVSDTGTGIMSEDRPRVFEPFFTTKKPGQGTGLGLAQVYGIVMQHEGFIDLESRPGQGTTFKIYLPPLVDMEDKAGEKGSRQLARGRGETILVVEDEPTVLEMIASMLDELGYHALTARSGKEALAVYSQRRDEISLVLTDIVMPEMDGVEVFRALKRAYPGVKVAAMTGYPLEDEGEDLLSEGFVAWMQKPMDLDALTQIVDKVFV